jgi:Spy/CpxP family protein refolding chaperone
MPIRRCELMKKAAQTVLTALAVSILLSGFSTSYADPGTLPGNGARFSPQNQGFRGGGQGLSSEQMQQRRAEMEGRLQKMGVSPEQLQQFKTLHEQNRQQAQVLKEQIQQRRQEFMQYVHSPNADEGTALAKQQELAQLMNQMHEMRIRSIFQMKKLLTPEQFQRLMERKQQGASGLGQRFQGAGGGRLGGRFNQQGAGGGGRLGRRFSNRQGAGSPGGAIPSAGEDSGL